MFDETETIDGNPKSWAAWKREAERLQKIIDEMTTNHPAHGPVSLDRLHQIREILSKAAAQSDGSNLGYAMADAVKVIDGVIASFGAEPVPFDALRDAVAEVSGGPVMEWSDIYKGHQAVPFINFNSLARIVDKFRTSQPAPVVPTFDEWLEIRGNKPLGWVKDAMRESYDACRASMLQAGNSPVTPDCWIPVSERMPDKLIPVMVMYADGEMWSAMWSGQFWDDGCTIPDPHAITHWREMPAAPKQEVKSALEHGMQRYAGAMQKLSEGDK